VEHKITMRFTEAYVVTVEAPTLEAAEEIVNNGEHPADWHAWIDCHAEDQLPAGVIDVVFEATERIV
jgi:hypothetical protein